MERKTRQLAEEMCGAVIGAGLASGREVVTFFTRFGRWSWAAIAVAVLTIAGVSCGLLRRVGRSGCTSLNGLCTGRLRRWWQGAFVALMVATAGTMLAGAGEIAALALPIHGAQWIGMGVTLVLAALLTRWSMAVLPRLGGGLLAVLALILLMGLLLPSYTAAIVEPEESPLLTLGNAALHGLCYGGFNMALASPLLCETGGRLTARQKDRSVIVTALLLGLVLVCYNALLQKHALLQGAAMPVIRLLGAFGKIGYGLGCVALYLAIFTTLMASLRGLRSLCGRKRCWLQYAAVIAVSLLGFTGAVGYLYPILGGVCFLLLMIVLGRKGLTSRQA